MKSTKYRLHWIHRLVYRYGYTQQQDNWNKLQKTIDKREYTRIILTMNVYTTHICIVTMTSNNSDSDTKWKELVFGRHAVYMVFWNSIKVQQNRESVTQSIFSTIQNNSCMSHRTTTNFSYTLTHNSTELLLFLLLSSLVLVLSILNSIIKSNGLV